MSANIDAVLARLDEMNNGEINYEVYRELHDLVSAIEDDVQAPIELFPGTLGALDALSIRARTTSPDAATEELLKRVEEAEAQSAEDRVEWQQMKLCPPGTMRALTSPRLASSARKSALISTGSRSRYFASSSP